VPLGVVAARVEASPRLRSTAQRRLADEAQLQILRHRVDQLELRLAALERRQPSDPPTSDAGRMRIAPSGPLQVLPGAGARGKALPHQLTALSHYSLRRPDSNCRPVGSAAEEDRGQQGKNMPADTQVVRAIVTAGELAHRAG
jgi:hypothetical protein